MHACGRNVGDKSEILERRQEIIGLFMGDFVDQCASMREKYGRYMGDPAANAGENWVIFAQFRAKMFSHFCGRCVPPFFAHFSPSFC